MYLCFICLHISSMKLYSINFTRILICITCTWSFLYPHIHSGHAYSLVPAVIWKPCMCLWRAVLTRSTLLCYNNCIVVGLVKSLYVSCISGIPRLVDKTCALDVWHASCVCWLTKHAPMMNLLVWCLSSVTWVLNHMTNPCATWNIPYSSI